MQGPDDFGLSAIATLSHVDASRLAPRSHEFWRHWREQVRAVPARLGPVRSVDEADPTATHQFESLRRVRISCTLIDPPPGTPWRRGAVVLHGYDDIPLLADDAKRWSWLAREGVGVLVLRVRGFAGSRMDSRELADSPLGWITHGLEVPYDHSSGTCLWSLSGAVADVVIGALALRAHGVRRGCADARVALIGDSFGGGLAVIAAAQLGCTVDRLAVSTPSLGNWAWRGGARAGGGLGRQVREFLTLHRGIEDKIADTLALFDAAVHARAAHAPALCRLALRDDVVPSPSAAAVFNALASPVGAKHRHLVRYGHYDGGVADGRLHVEFERARREFLLADARALAQSDTLWRANPTRTAIETTPTPSSIEPQSPVGAASLFGENAGDERESERVLIEAYRKGGRTLDDLPYSPEFDAVVVSVRAAGVAGSPREILRRLHNIRKAGRLPRLGAGASSPPVVERAHEETLAAILVERLGSLGQRDQLPYTPEFDAVAEQFFARTGLTMTHHALWRLIAKIAK